MKRVHYIDNYLLNPQHPVTVNLIGAGGTGSQVLTCLARLDVTLRALGHPGLSVTLYDPDTVTDANIGRQLFGPFDLGLNKAQCLVTRVNNFFGNDWRAVPDVFPAVLHETRRDDMAHNTVTCTDNIKSRLDLWHVLKAVPAPGYRDYGTPLYWMDFGNTRSTGQVVLGTVPKKIKHPTSGLYKTVGSLKVITRFVKYARVKETDSGPSCSLAEVPQQIRRSKVSVMKMPHRPDVASLFESLKPWFDTDEQPGEAWLRLKLVEGLYTVLHTDRNVYASLFDFADPWKIDILDFLNANYMYDLSLEELANYTGRSLTTFKRDFKKVSDETPQKWIIRKRLEVAHEMIVHQGRKVKDVIMDVGFKNMSHFSKIYKETYGMAPSVAY